MDFRLRGNDDGTLLNCEFLNGDFGCPDDVLVSWIEFLLNFRGNFEETVWGNANDGGFAHRNSPAVVGSGLAKATVPILALNMSGLGFDSLDSGMGGLISFEDGPNPW